MIDWTREKQNLPAPNNTINNPPTHIRALDAPQNPIRTHSNANNILRTPCTESMTRDRGILMRKEKLHTNNIFELIQMQIIFSNSILRVGDWRLATAYVLRLDVLLSSGKLASITNHTDP